MAMPSTLLTPARRQRLSRPALVSGLVLAGAVALHVRDPHTSGSWGFCPWRELTGSYCPGCGGLRAVNDLTNGHVIAAASSNLLFLALLPVGAYLFAGQLRAAWTGVPPRRASPLQRRVALVALAILTVVFTVLRNTPAGAWLAP
ncbi:MAG: DUF2752 domain-containing protein [Actinomycetota bacterium]|nr:DUF2752 domain-containing protein [Actinomycetota bacterium]